MNILVVGDIFGRPGREAIAKLLPKIIDENKIDFVIVNCENASGGRGVTPKEADFLLALPIDVMTAGNHIWEHKEIYPVLNDKPILRPANVKNPNLPGKGWVIKNKKGLNIAVIAMQGTIFMDSKGKEVVNAFKYIDAIYDQIKNRSDLIIIDFHAEATSEKRAFAWYLDGKVTAILGTHTHIQTSDEEIMPGGTAYISDLGMTGPHDSVIGMDIKTAMIRYITGEKKDFKVAKDNVRLEGVIIEVDEKSKKANVIKRIRVKS